MASEEPRVTWPDPEKPVLVTRDLTITRGKRDPQVVIGIRLIILVNACLYLVLEEGNGLRAGQVIARNLDLTHRRGGSREQPSSEQFVVFDTLNTARRGMALIEPGYRDIEAPDLRDWQQRLDWMVRTSWTLSQASEDQEAEFVLVAERTAKDHDRVRNKHKVAAVARTAQAASVEDSRGRKNTSRIPLICFAGERDLRRRVEEMRGIGRRTSWRQIVLEHYIDRMREITRQISRGVQYRMQSQALFGEDRTPRKVSQEADRMLQEAAELYALVGRPFSRNFQNVAGDLQEAAEQMKIAAELRESSRMGSVRALLHKVYRSARLLEFHWRLEELLVLVSRLHHSQTTPSSSQREEWHQELRRIHRQLTRPDSVTGERWEQGFRRQVLQHVVPQVHLADVHLMQPDVAGGPDIATMYERLKEACAPF